MNNYKAFLARLCEIENVSVKEIMELTGKSQSVVYNWLNPLKPKCFPSFEDLGKMVFRLGISFDDFINFRHPIYEDDGKSARTYYLYTHGQFDRQYIGNEILELKNYDEVIKTYISDRIILDGMIKDYIEGHEIDTQRFDLLCKALMPVVDTEFCDIGDSEVYYLSSYYLEQYKAGAEWLKESIEDDEVEEEYSHEIIYPDINEPILLAAERNIELLKKYLLIIDEKEKSFLLKCYNELQLNNQDFDKKGKIKKQLGLA
jgi:transcriptional regulator with XRE-family HTH domain